MRRSFFAVPFITIAFSGSLLIPTAVALAQGDQGPDQMHGRKVWEADHEALLDAKLGGLKAGLKLTPDQEKLWAPFEAAVRSAAQMRMQHMQAMMERMHTMRNGMDDQDVTDRPDMMEMDEGGEGASPINRLAAAADRMSQAAAAMKQIADSAKPLYGSLDDSQKRIFGFLAREMLMMGRGPGGMGGWHHRHHGDEGGPDEQE
jgi:hypothetical protein